MTTVIINENLAVRPTTFGDAEGVFALYETLMHEYAGGNNRTLEEFKVAWTTPGFDLSRSARSVFAPDKRLIGHIEVWDTGENLGAPYMWGYVHPDYRRSGIGTHLVQWAEQRAREVLAYVPENTRVTLYATCPGQDETTKRLLEANGMTVAGKVWRMVVEMEDEPEAPEWPEGITVYTLADQPDLRAVYLATKKILQDDASGGNGSFESGFRRFRHWVENDPKHDPSLWFFALAGEEIAGLSLGETQSGEDRNQGYIGGLGVWREYRYPGLRRALLQHSFREYWNRGQRKVSLHIDINGSPRVARFYERAGMCVERASTFYGKELVPGTERRN